MFMTSFFLFLILISLTSVVALIIRISLEIFAHFRPGKFVKLRRRFSSYYIGNLLRVVLLAYFAVATMAFYQFTLHDSWAITLLAVMTLSLFLVVATYITIRLRRAGGTSLFFDERLKSKYGVLYDQYALSAYWFFVPVLAYQLVKAAIVGLGSRGESPNHEFRNRYESSASWAQIILLLLVEVCFAVVVIWKRPFSSKTPNRLNSVLGCVRVLNIIMLGVLIESSAISDISRTAVGLAIIITQAIMMVVLAILILYQLGNALWRLWLTMKNKDQEKDDLKDEDSLESDEDIVVSIKGCDKYNKDGDDPLGRTASEISRSSNESMTSLVGMMGIGSNPTIRYTPASDDEDEEPRKDTLIGRCLPQNQPLRQKSKETKEDTMGGTHNSTRDSSQSEESDSSLILDYYNPAYLPSGHRSKTQLNSDEHWVQSAYMTRRRSESSAHSGLQNTHRSKSNSKASAQRWLAQEEEEDDDEEEEEEYEELQLMLQQQQRRRPKSLSTTRYAQEQAMNDIQEPEPQPPSRSARLPSFATFQGTYIPESLLDGPPPPPIMPFRRMSTVPTTPLSSVMVNPPSLYPVASLGRGSPTAATSMTASILNFEEYRFPDERATRHSDDSQGSVRRAAIIAAQRNIHPLSPFHPDFQHPDDLYNASMPSPNEEGPTTPFVNNRTSQLRVNIPNMPQDGKNSRRESRSSAEHTISTTAPTSSPSMRRAAPGLRIITNPSKIAPPPQIPVPALPTSPNSTSMTAGAISATVGSMLSSSPASSSLQSLTSSNPVQAKTIPPNATASAIGRKRSSSNVVECQLVSSSPNGSPNGSLYRQRALTATLTTIPNAPLTVSNVYRDTRAAI
ncbi:hypothetical protein BGZ76_002660 [Entomortierella beljakovae]|nr:hypothetical protein BGZ76_002660 [Entomortierella beljakovae]